MECMLFGKKMFSERLKRGLSCSYFYSSVFMLQCSISEKLKAFGVKCFVAEEAMLFMELGCGEGKVAQWCLPDSSVAAVLRGKPWQ